MGTKRTTGEELTAIFEESVLNKDYYNKEKQDLADVFAAIALCLSHDNPLFFDDEMKQLTIKLLANYLELMNDVRSLGEYELDQPA